MIVVRLSFTSKVIYCILIHYKEDNNINPNFCTFKLKKRGIIDLNYPEHMKFSKRHLKVLEKLYI